MKDVVKKHPEAKLLLAGNGSEHDNLVKLIEELNLGNNVELLGYRTDIQDYVNICDLIVSASHREGLPLNIMEAMICGKPVIASDNRGHRELIKDNENGILVDLKNNNGFIDSINLLIDNKDIATKFSINNLKRIETFKVDGVKDELIKIYTNESRKDI